MGTWKTDNKREYGFDVTGKDLKKSSEGIKIIHEANDDYSLKEAHNLIENADLICFIGFGFHKTNQIN